MKWGLDDGLLCARPAAPLPPGNWIWWCRAGNVTAATNNYPPARQQLLHCSAPTLTTNTHHIIITASKRFLSAAYEIKICPPFSYQMLATKRWHCGSMRHKLVYRTTGRPITNSCQSFSPEEWFLFAQSAGRRAALSPLFLAHQSSFCVTVHLILEGKTKPSYR